MGKGNSSNLPFKDKFPNIASNNTPITYSYDYFFTLIGRKINIQSTEELENSETVQNMPSYPKNGSIKQLNGTIIVKFKKYVYFKKVAKW